MFATNPIHPSSAPIRWVLPPGPSEAWPRVARRPSRAAQRGQLQAVAAVAFAAIAAFGVGFAAGATDAERVATPGSGPMPGEFRLGPGNLPPPGIVIPLD